MTKKKAPMLSKSRFMAGLQCHLRLWYECYNRELASEVTPVQQAVFDVGQDFTAEEDGTSSLRITPESQSAPQLRTP